MALICVSLMLKLTIDVTMTTDTRNSYSNYSSRNPFYQESVSEIADTPSLSDHNEDTPMTFTTLGKRSPTFTLHSPSNHKRPYTSVSSTLQQKLAEERKRMDKLQSNLQKIRRQVIEPSLTKRHAY